MVKKTSLCMVGAGSIGRRHLRLLKERGDVSLGVVEPHDESWSRLVADVGELERFASMDEALGSGRFEAFAIATPHGLHAKMAIAALEAGCHVFCEKPMSDSLSECRCMTEAARKSGKVFSVGFMFHFDPFVRKVKEIVDSGRIGKVLHFSSRFATYNCLKCSVTRHQAHTPYSLVMDCIHDADLLCWMCGSAPDYAWSSAYQAGDLELTSNPNFIDTVFRWKDSKLGAHLHYNYVEHPQVHALEIVGDRGSVRGDFMKPSIILSSIEGTSEVIDFSRDFDDVYRAEWEAFLAAMRGERAPENPAESAALATLVMEAQKVSARTGREVALADLG